MNKYFAYLTDDDSSSFFQKLACETADQEIVPANTSDVEIEKIASATGMQKLARRVERDIDIIKNAGVSGYNFGTTTRGLNYIDSLIQKDQFDAEYGVAIFDKVSASAIEHDLSLIHAELLKTAGDEYRAWVDHTVSDIGTDLVKAASLEKEAILGLLRGAKAMSKAFKATRAAKLGRGVAAKAALKAPKQSFKAWRTEAAVAKRGKAAVKLKGAVNKAQIANKAQALKLRSAKGIKDTAVRKSILPGIERKGAKVRGKGQDKIRKAKDNFDKRNRKVSQRRDIEGGKGAVPNIQATQATKATKSLSAKASSTKKTVEMGRSKAQDKATIAAKGLKGKKTGSNSVKTDAPKDEATFGGSLTNLRDKGWKNLSPAEKNKVIQAGAGAYMAKETLLD